MTFVRVGLSAIRRLLSVFGLGVSVFRLVTRDEIQKLVDILSPKLTEHALVRVGPNCDGGYLLPDDFENVDAVFSPGVGDACDFELFFAERGVPCFMADFSVEKPPSTHDNFNFIKMYLGNTSGESFVTLEEWVRKTGVKGNNLLLQMDIEGTEWGVLRDTSTAVLNRFRILVIEFHDLANRVARRDCVDGVCYEETRVLLERILESFVVVHLHPNNCGPETYVRGIPIPPVLEITFIRKDRVAGLFGSAQVPHLLDSPNVPGRRLPKIPVEWGA